MMVMQRTNENAGFQGLSFPHLCQELQGPGSPVGPSDSAELFLVPQEGKKEPGL